jgi:phosphohistidine swiveling domain-containing protein
MVKPCDPKYIIRRLGEGEWFNEVGGRKVYLIWTTGIVASYIKANKFFKDIFGIQTSLPAIYLLRDWIFEDVLWNREITDNISRAIVESTMKDRRYLNLMLEDCEKRHDEVIVLCDKLRRTDFQSLSKEELLSYQREVMDTYYRNFIWALIPRVVVKAGEDRMNEWLLGKYDKKKAIEIMNILTSTLKESYVGKEAKDLLEMGIRVEHGADLGSEIEGHAEEYGWIGVSFWNEVPYDTEHFLNEFKKISEIPGTFEDKLGNLEEQKAQLEREKGRLVKELKMDQEKINLADTLSEMIFIKDYNKEANVSLAYYSRPLWAEIGKRIGRDRDYVMSLFPDEIEKAMEGEMTSDETIAERRKALVVCDMGEGLCSSSGMAAEEIFSSLTAPEMEKNELNGTPASFGHAIGKAKIVITQDDFSKVEEGDILIAPMTTPDFVPLMKKARAIVTDEGGICCHAAIVSRELGIPCIVGTVDATKFFKDGDLVEVRANHGIVRKVHSPV